MNPDLNAGVNTVAQQRINNQAFLTGQNALTSDFLNKYTGAIGAQGTTQQAAERIGGELGLPQLRQNAFNLNQSLIDIPSVNTASARGFDINQNQLSRIIATKQAELSPLAQRATSQAQFAEGELGTRLGYLQNDWNRQLLPLTTEKDFLTDRMARETSMYSQENQSELEAILNKISSGITLSEGEKNRAQQLAIAEKGYENALKIAQSKTDTTNPYMSLGEGSTLFNTGTGKAVYTAPKIYKPGAYPSPVTPTINNKPTSSPTLSQTIGGFDWSKFGL